MRCPNCGSPFKEGAKFCGKCGHQIRQVQPRRNPSDNVNVQKRNTAQSQNRSGKYSAAQTARKTKKQSSGNWIIGLLVALIVALICIIAFVIFPMIKDIFSTSTSNAADPKESVSFDRTPSVVWDTSGSEKEEKESKNITKTIYVATNKKTTYETDDHYIYETSYSLDRNGIVSKETSYSSYIMDGELKESSSETTYVVDYENILQYMDTGTENDEKLAEKYRTFIDKQKHIEEDSTITIISIDNNTICRKVITSLNASWQDICEEGSHFDYSYNEAGKKTEYIGFIRGNVRTRTTYQYDAENNLTLQVLHDYSTNRETKYELLYDSENRISEGVLTVIDLDSGAMVKNHTKNSYNENGKLEKSINNDTELSIYMYDEVGNLKKTSSYNGEGSLVNDVIYTYEEIDVPAESVELLCHLYDNLGIEYEILE